jgi:ABC-type oligopeptide transport system substrate-binding subunit
MRLDTDGMVWERNRNYFGEVSGNVGRVEFRFIPEQGERWRTFLQGEGDVVYAPGGSQAAPFETVRPQSSRDLWVGILEFNAQLPPLNDVRVRRALAHALDLESLAAVRDAIPAHGGMVHPEVPGHSPGLKLRFDPEHARRLFSEAGYPDGAGCPPLILEHSPGNERHSEEIVHQWQDILKVGVELRPLEFSRSPHNPTSHCGIFGFVGDYPDPDTFLRQLLGFHTWLTPDALGAQYMQLVEDAVQVRNRVRRMAMYREADRILVAERALVIPLDYGLKLWWQVLRPWVKGLEPMPTVSTPIKHVRIEPH